MSEPNESTQPTEATQPSKAQNPSPVEEAEDSTQETTSATKQKKPRRVLRFLLNVLIFLLIIGLIGLSASAFAADHPELKAFPAAKEGMQRFVIVLPHKERGEDESFRVEIIVGKQMLTDGVNQVRLGSAI